MAGQVVAVASGKGGVGKTTTVLNLGVVLRRADHSVALVDADLGMANLGAMLGVGGDLTLHDVLSGEAALEDALVQEASGFSVLAGSPTLTDYPDADPRNLGGVLESLAADYDFVLVDTGAGMSHEDVLPLGLADQVILVTTPDPAAVGDTRKTAELAGLAEGDVAGLVVTKADPDTDAEAVAAEVGVDLLGVIPFDQTVRESTAASRPLEAVDPEAPAAAAYRRLAGTMADGAADPLSGVEAADAAPADAGAEESSSPEASADAPEPEPAPEAADADDPAPETVAEDVAADVEYEPPAPDAADEAPSDEAGAAAEAAEREATEPADATASGEPVEDDGVEEPETAADPADETDEPAAEPDDEGEAPEADADSADEEGADADEAGDDEEEEDYLAEWEDDEPESKGGLLSRLWPFG